MSRADELFLQNCRDILQNGVWDTDQQVRPHWEDGTPAHTIKKFGIVNRYDLSAEFPILTLRRTYWKTAVDELLWIWQKKSNNVHDLNAKIWDQWADETGSIGKAYGYQLGVKHQYSEGEFDQVDRVLYDLKHNPASRRILTNIYNFQDLHEMHLYPCAYSMRRWSPVTFSLPRKPKRRSVPCLSDSRERQDKGAALPQLAAQRHTGAQIRRAVLHDGKAQARAAPGMAFIHPVEPLKHPVPRLGGNPHAGILHGEARALAGVLHRHGNAAALPIVCHGIVAQVIEDLLQNLGHAADHDITSLSVSGRRGGL